MTFKLGILASGNGTDLDGLYSAIDAGQLPEVEVAVVLSDRAAAPGLK